MSNNLDISFGLSPKQRAPFLSNKRYRMLSCGQGFGKSYTAAAFAIYRSILFPNVVHCLAALTYSMSRDVHLSELKNILNKNNLIEGKDYRYNGSDHKLYIHKWNGIISLASADNPTSMLSKNFGTLIVDEFESMNKLSYDNANRGVRAIPYEDRVTLMIGTPEDTGDNWVEELIEKQTAAGTLDIFTGSSFDNPIVGEEYGRDRLSMLDPLRARAYVYGERISFFGGAAHPHFSSENIIDDEEIDIDRPLIISQDYNFDPNTAVIAQVKSGSVYILDEVSGPFTTPEKMDYILDKIRDHRGPVILYGDASAQWGSGHGSNKHVGGTDYDMIVKRMNSSGKKWTFKMPGANPPRIDRLNVANRLICNGAGERRLFVCKRCKAVVADLKRVKYDEFIGGRFKDKSLGHMTDALHYFLHYEFSEEKKTPGTVTSKFEL